jgi:hypothetical protein
MIYNAEVNNYPHKGAESKVISGDFHIFLSNLIRISNDFQDSMGCGTNIALFEIRKSKS